VPEIRALTSDFYHEKISRDEIASLAKAAAEAALNGNDVLRDQIRFGAESLAQNVRSVAKRLHLSGHISVAGVGGMFRGQVMRACFKSALGSLLPQADLIDPRFGPAIGALLLAYRAAGIQIDEALLKELEN
jgi:N-acetylglucosamine kinase-like BadF-type ATPase